jgi:hypothetical protein
MMAIWQGCGAANAHLSLVWSESEANRKIVKNIVYSDLPDRLSSRRAVAVAGVVAEWLMQERSGRTAEDEWDVFSRLRDGAWMTPDELELTEGKITWHAVKRACKLLRRHWSIVRMSSASKRKDLLFRVRDSLADTRGSMRPQLGLRQQVYPSSAGNFHRSDNH